MEHWDPIGVAGVAKASDEYDAYADKAYVMLMDEEASADDIAHYLFYLFEIAENYMGLGDQPRLRDRLHFALLLERLDHGGGPAKTEVGGKGVGTEDGAADTRDVEWRIRPHRQATKGGRGEIPIDAELLFVTQRHLD